MKPLLQVPLTGPLHRERCSITRALFAYLSEPPEKEPPHGVTNKGVVIVSKQV
jgi:hypothetical protein